MERRETFDSDSAGVKLVPFLEFNENERADGIWIQTAQSGKFIG